MLEVFLKNLAFLPPNRHKKQRCNIFVIMLRSLMTEHYITCLGLHECLEVPDMVGLCLGQPLHQQLSDLSLYTQWSLG